MKKLLLALNLIFAIAANGQSFEWAKRIGGPSDMSSVKMVAKDGYVYTTGRFQGLVDFDPNAGISNLTSYSGSGDIYVMKLDSLGNLVWRKRMGSNDEDEPSSMFVDDAGNVYITGEITGTADMDPGAGVYNLFGNNLGAMFVSKLDANGNFVWAKAAQTAAGYANSYGGGIAVDSSGNVIIVGTYQSSSIDSVDMNPDSSAVYFLPENPNGGVCFFVLKLNSSGNFTWAKHLICGGSYGSFTEVMTDNAGNIISAGSFSGNVDFDPGAGDYTLPGPPNNVEDVFILKLNAAGNFVWAGSIGGYNNGSGEDRVYGITSDPAGSIYLTGSFNGTNDFDPDITTTYLVNYIPGTSSSIYILKLNPTGKFVWVKALGASGAINGGTGIFADDSGYVYTTGTFNDTLDFDPGIGTFNIIGRGGNYDIFLHKMDTAGNFISAKHTGGSGDERSTDVAVTKRGEVYTTGRFKGQCDFNPDSLNYTLGNASSYYAFVQKLSQTPCDNLTVVADTAIDVTCATTGRVVVHALNGLPNYTYTWNTDTAATGASKTLTGSGVYTVTVKDVLACKRVSSIVINGPTSQSSFDLNSNLVAATFRPGFGAWAWLDAFNAGCAPAPGGKLQIVVDSLVNFDTASITPSSVSGDTILWNMPALNFDSAHFVPALHVTVSPLAAIGDTVFFKVKILPLAGEADTLNNVKTYWFIVRGSYDPNIKEVYPRGVCEPAYVSKTHPLTYTIHFQNTGNDTAFTVIVEDTISNALDLSTVKVVGKSHELIAQIDSNIIKFRFNNILLPDSGTNERLSHGYVIFEITPKANVANNTVVQNSSLIYFDFNAPVLTNSVSNTLTDVVPELCNSVGISQNIIDKTILLYPNPANNTLFIQSSDLSVTDILIYNMAGNLLQTNTGLSANNAVDITSLAAGIYIAEIKTNEGVIRKRWTKL